MQSSPSSGFCVAVLNDSALERYRRWIPDEDRAHRFAQLESEEFGAAYISQSDQRVTGPYLRITSVYKHGVRYRTEPGQQWLKLSMCISSTANEVAKMHMPRRQLAEAAK